MNTMNQEQVKHLYNYNPETGVFNRKDGYKGIILTPNGYLRAYYKGKSYAVTRLIWVYMTAEQPNGDIDHIDHDRTNNRWDNLRVVTRQVNMRNASKSKANTSGFTGVTWCRQQNRWAAQIMVGGKNIKLGRFDCKLDAIAARIAANKKYSFHENHGKSNA